MTNDPVMEAVYRLAWPLFYVLEKYDRWRHPEEPASNLPNLDYNPAADSLEHRALAPEEPLTPLPVGISIGCGGTYARRPMKSIDADIVIGSDLKPRVNGQTEERTEDS